MSMKGKYQYPELQDRGWLIQKYKVENRSIQEIAKLLGCGSSTVARGLKRARIDKKRDVRLDDEIWLNQKYWDEQLNTIEIAKIIGCSDRTVRNAIEKAKISLRGRSERCKLSRPTKYPELNDYDWLCQKYSVERASSYQIAEIIGCTRPMVSSSLRGHGIEIRPPGESVKGNIYAPQVTVLKDKDWVNQKYWMEGFSITKIAVMIGCSQKAVSHALKFFNIPLRTPSEEVRLRFKDENYAKALFKAIAKKPTHPEKIWQEIAIEKHSLLFEYTGNGGVVIGNKCPDFVHLTKKIVVEVFGYAFHSPLFTFRKTMPYHQTYKGTMEHYKKHGYKCVIFWDRDLERKDAEQFVLSVLRKEGVME